MKTLYIIALLFAAFATIKTAEAQLMTNDNVGITIQSGVQLTVQGDIQNQNTTVIDNNGIIDLSGNWQNDAVTNCFGTSQGTVILNGANQSISGTSSTTFNNLLLQGSGTKTLLTDISCGGNYAAPAGILDIGNVVLALNTNAVAISNSSANAISSGLGYIVSETADNSSKIMWSINNVLGQHIIPFGNASGTKIPLIFNLTSGNAGDVTFSTYATNANNLPLPVTPALVTHVRNNNGNDNSANTVDRFWQIDATGSPTASLTFSYANTENAVNGNSNMVAQRWVNPTSGWASPQAGQSNPTAQSVLITNVTAFGPWAVTNFLSPLPIDLLSFTAKSSDNKKVLCDWVTASEQGNDYFNIERSKNGIDFNTIGIVDGAGTSNQTQTYNFIDNNPYTGTSYYRLKQTDFNGNSTYSGIRKVTINKESDFNVVVYPNPITDFVYVTCNKTENVVITITDLTGKVMKQLNSDSQQTQIDFMGLAAGTFFITVQSENGNSRKTFKVIKQ